MAGVRVEARIKGELEVQFHCVDQYHIQWLNELLNASTVDKSERKEIISI